MLNVSYPLKKSQVKDYMKEFKDITFKDEDEFKKILVGKEHYLYTIIKCKEEK